MISQPLLVRMDTSFSLLDQLCQPSNPQAWDRLVTLYTPLLQTWLHDQDNLPTEDVDDLVQEVLLAVAQELPKFEHNRQRGAFRKWLRLILVHRLRNFWRSRQQRPSAVGGSDFLKRLERLEDDTSDLSALWNRQHDQQILDHLLREAQTQFAGHVWQAFQRQVLEKTTPAVVAAELNMSLTAVYTAKSRVLSLLRQKADGLIS
ncbi:MAG: RNA polymerase sigma factor [Gemmataceae bacterium]